MNRRMTPNDASPIDKSPSRVVDELPAAESSSDECPKIVRVSTGARLHFGLLDTAPPFGGAGVMIDQYGVELEARRFGQFEVHGEHKDRITAIAQRMKNRLGLGNLPRCRVELRRCPPAHAGLGSGTQVALAAANAMLQLLAPSAADPQTIQRISDRGKRSAVGVHGFFLGGLIAEGFRSGDFSDVANDPAGHRINAIEQRVEIPESWRVVVMRPRASVNTHKTVQPITGQNEREKFSRLKPAGKERGDRLQRLLKDTLIPAAQDADFSTFADSLRQYNRLSGELFADVQGGAYNGIAVADLVALADRLGGRGAGQSSWGDGVFSWFSDPEAAERFCSNASIGAFDSKIASIRNRPRELARIDDLASSSNRNTSE
ncbi:MAG: beta-ribofuranosylaminobenzene 5'-phosphate synthase [Planctomycetota bacterium]